MNNPLHRRSRNRPFQIKKKLLQGKSHGESIHFLPGDIKTLEDRLGILLGDYRAGDVNKKRSLKRTVSRSTV